MKRLLMILLACVIALAMVGCGGAPEASESTSAEPTQTATPEPTEEPTETPTPEPTEEPTEEPTPEASIDPQLNTNGDLEGMTYLYNSEWEATSMNNDEYASTGWAYSVPVPDNPTLSSLFFARVQDFGDSMTTILDNIDMEGALDTLKEAVQVGAGVTDMDMHDLDGVGDLAWYGEGTIRDASNPMFCVLVIDGTKLYQLSETGGSVAPLFPQILRTATINGQSLNISELIDAAEGAAATYGAALSEPATASASSAEDSSEVTTGMRNALDKANRYLDLMGFSEDRLRKQLEHEEFAPEEIEYAMANITPDWNAEAAEKAQSYMDTMSMSRDRLIKQLEHEGFTPEQAEYGVSQVYD